MNDDDIATLLERSVSSTTVSPPPVRDVTGRGRRRLRWQRTLQIGGTAVVVAAIAIGATLVRSGSGPGPTTPTVATPPTQSQLLGDWQLVSPTPSLHRTGKNEDPNLVTFTISLQHLWWSGYDGCNWVSGPVDLGTDGAFSTPNNASTLRGCVGIDDSPGSDLVTGVSVIERAASVRLDNGRLSFYDRAGTLVGTFVRQQATTTGQLPGRVPSAADLVGRWHWVTKTPPSHRGTHVDPSLLWFTFHDVGLQLPPGHAPVLHWSGYAGCNNFSTGEVQLSASGQFSTSRNVVSDLLCTVAPKPGENTVSRVILSASSVRLVAGRLDFFDGADHLVGTFVRL